MSLGLELSNSWGDWTAPGSSVLVSCRKPIYRIDIGDKYCGQFSSWKSHPTKSIYIKEVPKRVFQVLWNSFPNGKVPTKCI